VTNRVTRLGQDIYADGGWYWWGWTERIAPTGDVPAVAATITRSLGPPPAPARD
jgi:hypothetical protein